jgi:hypothetical protein
MTVGRFAQLPSAGCSGARFAYLDLSFGRHYNPNGPRSVLLNSASIQQHSTSIRRNNTPGRRPESRKEREPQAFGPAPDSSHPQGNSRP